ncbi:MAG: undecaprenyl-diphosphate phosphatase [Candidatus Cloacimonetes bacterium]|nr:undecaprenyl-diphosphate phosphatase [Candidatus Cloacimonadota bacterium]
MEIFKSLILGIVQGLTEFIPISSSGHLVLFKYLLNVEMPGLTFEVFVHLGSLIAVFIYFRKDLKDLIKSVITYKNIDINSIDKTRNNRKTVLWLLVASGVTGVLGFLFKDMFENMFEKPLFAACMIAMTGFILFFSDKIKIIPPSTDYNAQEKSSNLIQSKKSIFQPKSGELNLKKAMFIGLGQALAITPGISRSGTTITFALLSGMDRKSAATFSFLLSIPAILGANIADFKNLMSLDSSMIVNSLIGFIAAFISGFLVINWLIKLIIKAKLHYFSYYCWGAALIFSLVILLGN